MSPIPVAAAQANIAVGGQGLEHPVSDLHDGDIEGPPAQIVNDDRHDARPDSLATHQFAGSVKEPLLKAVGDCRRGGLVQEAGNFETGQAGCLASGLTPRVVKIRRDRNDGLGDRPGAVSASIFNRFNTKAAMTCGCTWRPATRRW